MVTTYSTEERHPSAPTGSGRDATKTGSEQRRLVLRQTGLELWIMLVTTTILGACSLTGADFEPVRCADITCDDAHRTCVESDGDRPAYCGECLYGLVLSTGRCAPEAVTYNLRGKVSGLAGEGLVLRLDVSGGEQLLTLSPGATTFSFDEAIVDDSDFAISVGNQPHNPDQTCYVNNGIGTIEGRDYDVAEVWCFANERQAFGGAVSGLDADMLPALESLVIGLTDG